MPVAALVPVRRLAGRTVDVPSILGGLLSPFHTGGGRVAAAYDRHLFHEKTLTTVTAYTRADGEELLRLASALSVEPVVTGYPFDAADRALDDLRHGAVMGVAVLEVRSPAPRR